MDRYRPLTIVRFRGSTVVIGYRDNMREDIVLRCIRSWLFWFEDRGVIKIGKPESDNYFELRKRRWKTRADVAVFRYRNSDFTRKYFREVRAAFEKASVQFELALTRKARRPRAIEVRLDPYDPLTPRRVLNLANVAFNTCSENEKWFDISCHGVVREDASDPPMKLFVLLPDRPSFGERCGYLLGYVVGRIRRWLVGG